MINYQITKGISYSILIEVQRDRLPLKKPEISTGSMGYLARKGFSNRELIAWRTKNKFFFIMVNLNSVEYITVLKCSGTVF